MICNQSTREPRRIPQVMSNRWKCAPRPSKKKNARSILAEISTRRSRFASFSFSFLLPEPGFRREPSVGSSSSVVDNVRYPDCAQTRIGESTDRVECNRRDFSREIFNLNSSDSSLSPCNSPGDQRIFPPCPLQESPRVNVRFGKADALNSEIVP